MNIDLGLDRFVDRLKIKRENDNRYIFDLIRQKWIVLQPEEMIRQLAILYLLEEKQYRKNLIGMEKGFRVVNDKLAKRFDLLVYDHAGKPFLLVECKAPKVKIDEQISDKTIFQAITYNKKLRVRYFLATNGIESFCCALDYKRRSFEFVDEVPAFG